jgi:hypothetical protein
MDGNAWELFTEDVDAFDAAHEALERGWARAATMRDPDDARHLMEGIMERHIEAGACDTEARSELNRRMQEAFKNEVG